MRQTLSERVASQIRAEMGRQEVTKAELARRMGKAETWVGRRMRGRSAITLSDLEEIATALNTPIDYFMIAERVA